MSKFKIVVNNEECKYYYDDVGCTNVKHENITNESFDTSYTECSLEKCPRLQFKENQNEKMGIN
ncbi:MAG: hypothetical protein ACOC1O_05275 [bacterium]